MIKGRREKKKLLKGWNVERQGGLKGQLLDNASVMTYICTPVAFQRSSPLCPLGYEKSHEIQRNP